MLELIFRRPVSPKVLHPIMMGFVGLLIAFMLYVSFYDVRRVIGSIAPDMIGISTETAKPATEKQNDAAQNPEN